MRCFRNLSFCNGITIAFAAIALTGAAGASTVNATLNGVNLSKSVSISTDGGWHYSNVLAGELDWSRTGGSAAGVPSHFSTFCIELDETVKSGMNYTYNLGSLAAGPTSVSGGMGSSKANVLAELYGRFLSGLTQSDSNYAAAFQIAIWEIVTDSNRNLSSGKFRVKNQGSYYGQAQSMLSAINGGGPRLNLQALLQTCVQDQVYVPEPASLTLIALGLLSQLRRR